jgi:hypothetical protein
VLFRSDNGFNTKRQKVTQVNVYKGAIDEIERICSGLRGRERTPNWGYELERILAYQKGDTEVRRVISDLWLHKDNEDIYISIKTVKPNLDQTEKAKKDMLLLKAHNPNFNTYFGLYYNPGGEQQKDYNWSVPSKIFDMQNDNCVLIGRNYWDTIGGAGTYDELLKVFDKVGKETRDLILKL